MSPPSPTLPPRPQHRPTPPRFANLCFWVVLLLWITAIVFVWLLAYSRNVSHWQLGMVGNDNSAFALIFNRIAHLHG